MIRPFLVLSVAALAAAVDVEPAKLATADAAPLDPGAWEIAIGASWSTADRCTDAEGRSEHRGGTLTERGIGVGLTYGIVEGVDAGIGIGWTGLDDEACEPDAGSGPTDLELGAKWRLWQGGGEGDSWAAAILPSVTAPLGRGQDADEELPTASRFWTAGIAFATSGNMGIVALNADIGYVHAFGSEDTCEGYDGTYTADAAIGVQVTEAIQPEIELNWSRDRVEEGDAPWALAVTAGVQVGLDVGRLGLGIQRVVDGALTDETTSAFADLAFSF